jgi:hypothetical protein
MHERYLGDSYDAVKRLWCQALYSWAPLHAARLYIPGKRLQAQFTALTGIPMLADQPPKQYSVLLDPDTGIRLAGARGRRHVTLDTIADTFRSRGVVCVVTFDQSYVRQSGHSRSEQQSAKLRAAAELGLQCFYYQSHAPFLFSFRNASARRRGRKCLTDAGVPEGRLKMVGGDT